MGAEYFLMSALAEKQFLVAKVGAKKAGAAVTITLAGAGGDIQ